jgi:pimeloyl-ACP methyl ester carboxylesterase
MDSWSKVFPEIGKNTTVFAYNRPGYGNSSKAITPRDGATVVEELRALLNSRGLRPPYVLVGHSLGGIYVQLFARKYPDDVVGLVLVDSSHPSQFEGSGAVENWPIIYEYISRK